MNRILITILLFSIAVAGVSQKPRLLLFEHFKNGTYAMVNIQKYQNVAIGDTVSACEKTYVKMLRSGGGSAASEAAEETISGTIKRIAQGVVDGNTHFYVVLEESDLVFDIPIVDYMEIVKYDIGDKLSLTYTEGDPVCTVSGLENK